MANDVLIWNIDGEQIRDGFSKEKKNRGCGTKIGLTLLLVAGAALLGYKLQQDAMIDAGCDSSHPNRIPLERVMSYEDQLRLRGYAVGLGFYSPSGVSAGVAEMPQGGMETVAEQGMCYTDEQQGYVNEVLGEP